MFKKILAVAVVVLALGMVLVTESSEAGAMKDGLIMSIVAEPTLLDPKMANDLVTLSAMYQVYDTLYREENGDIVPSLAESYELSANGLEYTFKLRQGVKFHNGEVMTVEDVLFSYERAIAAPTTVRVTGTIAKVEKIDDKTIKITLKFPYAPFLACTSGANLSIVSKKAVEKTGDKEFAQNPVGTGPYKLVEWKRGDRMVFTAFEDYFRGKAKIKDLVYKIIPDPATATIALENNEIDFINTLTPSEKINLIDRKDIFLGETAQSGLFMIAFNNRDGLFTNEKLREAVSYAIDREAIILGALEGNGLALEAAIPQVCFGYPEGFKANPYDPEKAKALVAEAGYPNGVSVKMHVIEAPIYSKPAEIIQEQLRKVGIRIELVLMERATYLSQVQSDLKYEISVIAFTALVPDADFITYTRLHGNLIGGGANQVATNDPELNKALDAARMSSNPAERQKLYLQVSEIVKAHSYFVPLYSNINIVACNSSLKGVKANAFQKYPAYNYHWE